MRLCLGTAQFGQDYGVQGSHKPSREKVYEMVSYAIENDITEFDTAAAYGEAEEVLGEFIRTNPELGAKMNVVSKLHPNALITSKESEWKKIAIHCAEESLNRIGITHFSAYHFHRAQYLFNPRAVEALFAVKEEGLADMVGAATYDPKEALKALELSQIEAIQIPYNVFDRRLDQCDFFKHVRERKMRVYARSAFLQGLALMKPEDLPDKMDFAKKYLLDYLDACQAFHISPVRAAIGYVASKQEIDFIVFGVDNLEQLKECIGLQKTVIPEEVTNCFDSLFSNADEELVNPALWK